MKAGRCAQGAIIVLAGVLVVATTYELRTGAQAIDECDAALVRGDRTMAIARARAAAEAVVPASPYPSRGYHRLESIAREAEARGDDEISSSAWAAMRAAALSTRGFGVRTAEWLDLANAGIARVGSAAWGAPDAAKLKTDVRPTEQAILESLHRQEPPTTTTFLLLAAGAAAFFGGVARIAWRAGAREPLSWRAARWPASAAAIGLVLYALACLRA